MTGTSHHPTAFIVLNPVAGIGNAGLLERAIESRFHHFGWTTRIHLTQPDEDTPAIVAAELARGVDLVVAAGGDGTVASVSAGMAHSHVPLGILPTGTWNAIARNLKLPFTVFRAIQLMVGDHNIKKLVLMEVGDSLHAMNLSMGISVNMIKGSSREEKRKFGIIAYLTNLFKQVVGWKLNRYTIDADGVRYRGRASEIFVANYGMMGIAAIEKRLNVIPDDGKVDLLILRPRTFLDLPALIWQALIKREKRAPKYREISAVKTLTIRTTPPMQVQADGDLIGVTPIKITVIPRAVRVIVP